MSNCHPRRDDSAGTDLNSIIKIKTNEKDPQRRAFFSHMSDDLFRNVRELYEQVDAQFSVRSSEEGVGAQMASFCVYSCGLFSTYLVKYKNSQWEFPCAA